MEIPKGKIASYTEWLLKRLTLVLYDVFAVNAAYYSALLLRFYVNSEFSEYAVRFIEPFFKFAPWYTICCIVIFWSFKLYSGIWRYAGLNDMNRILKANMVAFVVQLAGSWIFFVRMPWTYYIIGGILQFGLIAASRFAFRFFVMEANRVARARTKPENNALIVGSGDTARMVLKRLEREKDSGTRPVCILDVRSTKRGLTLEGVPVWVGIESLKPAVARYHVNCVIIADPILSKENREEITAICEELELPIQNFSMATLGDTAKVSFKALMQTLYGPVEVVLNGKAQTFPNGESAVAAYPDSYTVTKAEAAEGKLRVTLVRDGVHVNDTSEEWVQDYKKETGEEISFF